jgi:5,10-methylenetetrahydromethanopterin reductase
MTFEVGLCLRSFDVGPREAALTASLAEKLGFTSFWMTEEMGRGSPPALSMSAAETSRLTLGTAIISIYSRTPMTTAMEAITLQEASGNRFILGLGVGGAGITARGHGAPTSGAVERMEEYIAVVRGFLTGQRVNYKGRYYNVSDIRLWARPPSPPPIYLAALNPKMLELAGRVADGLLLNMFDPKCAGYVEKHLRKGFEKAGRTPSEYKKYSFVLAAASDETDALDALRKSVCFYLLAPGYRRLVAEAGFGDVVETVGDAYSSKGLDFAAKTIPDELLDRVAVICKDSVTDRLREYADVGVTPLIYPQPRRGAELKDIVSILQAVSKEI